MGIRTETAYEPVLSDHIDEEAIETYDRASVAWPVDPQGYHYGASALRLPARDLAKFDYLYLNSGQWDGSQLVPTDYVAAATSATGSSPNLSAGYGWLWWVGTEGGRTFVARGLADSSSTSFPSWTSSWSSPAIPKLAASTPRS